jgi:hypothetical protein
MILLLAVVIGLIAGLTRAWVKKREYRYDGLRYSWLVLVAFIPQILVFFIPSISRSVSDSLAAVVLVSSQALLLLFAIFNIKLTSFWPIFTGFLANFLVISLNGGLMPISPETIKKMTTTLPNFTFQLGSRLGTGKDIVLNEAATRLAFLSDRFVVDAKIFIVAFSAGDILISLGVIWLLWSLGGPNESKTVEKK